MAFDRIWKFPLEITERQLVRMPAEFSILSVGLDPEDRICLWALVDSTYAQREVVIQIVETGKPLPHVGSYIGTVTRRPFVWHVFTGPSDSSNKMHELHFATRGNDRG